MHRLGFHVSIAGGVGQVLPRALARHCNTVQMFTSSPSQWRRGRLEPEEAAELKAGLAAADIRPHFVHGIYLLNLSSPDRTLRARSVRNLAEELQRAALVGAAGVVFHLGSVGEKGRRGAGVRRLARSLREVRARAGNDLPLILENSAGAGFLVGGALEEIAVVMAEAAEAEPLRLCLDTCHAFAAGLPVHTAEGLEQVLAQVEANFTSERLVLVHLNDALGGFGSRRDRHWHLGRGEIGRAGMRRILNHPRLRGLPCIMETPGRAEDDRRNMYAARRLLPREERPSLRRG